MKRPSLLRGALTAAFLLGASAVQAEPLNIRIGWVVTPAQLTPVLFQNKKILEHYGESYTVEPVKFRGSSPQITALAAGELDFAALAFSSLASAIENAGMDDIRAVSDVFQDGVGDYFSSEYFVREDSPIQDVQDLTGKQVASNGIGGAVDMALRKRLADEGLRDKEDYTLVELNFPNMQAALFDERVDLVGTVVPFSHAIDEAGGRVLFTMEDAMGGPTQMLVWAGRESYIEENREALLEFFEDYQRALQWFLDPANREEAIEIISDFTKQPSDAYQGWLFTEEDYYRDPQGKINLEALQRGIDVQRELGFLNAEIEISEFVDNSLVEEAAARQQ